jgi:hypothetical protein
MSSESPDPAEFSENDVAEIAVDGRIIARVADIDDLSKSPADEAAAITMIRQVIEDSAEEFEEEHGISPTEVLEKTEPDVQLGNETRGWESVPIDALTEDH